jgi:hypothetical protein
MSTYLVEIVNRPGVFCSLRQQCHWDGRTHQELIDTPVPALLPRVEALERSVDEMRKVARPRKRR